MSLTIHTGDCRTILPAMPSQSVQCCVTSPPYWGLRSYLPKGHPDKGMEIGQEKTPAEFVETMVAIFREVRRVLRDDGTLWLNLGDSYSANRTYQVASTKGGPKHGPAQGNDGTGSKVPPGLKPKDLVGIPWMVAFALRADGWYLRQDIIWSKPNQMPESVTDRCTKAHEYIFMLSKSERYYYDAAAIRNPPSADLVRQVEKGYNGADTKDYAAGRAQSASGTKAGIIAGARKRVDKQRGHGRRHDGFNDRWDSLSKEDQLALGSNKRSVWTVATHPFREAHFATFPPDLIAPCVLAGCPAGGMILDPFGGSGTSGEVALKLGRSATLIELNSEYVEIINRRCEITLGLPLA